MGFNSASNINDDKKKEDGPLLTDPVFFLLQSQTQDARHSGAPNDRARLDYVGVSSSSKWTQWKNKEEDEEEVRCTDTHVKGRK